MTHLGRFRVVSLVEGISYVLLLGIAMPLKYVGGNTEAVPLAGRIHGGLFVLFCIALVLAARERKWSRGQMTTAMVAAVLPLGAFWLEHRLRSGRFEH